MPPEAEETARRLKEAAHPTRDNYRLAEELLGIGPAEIDMELPDHTAYKKHDRAQLIRWKNLSIENDYQPIGARVSHISDNAIWWSSIDVSASNKQVEAAANLFEEVVRPIVHLTFGREPSPGIDNDPRVHFLLVEEDGWKGVFGYFTPYNQFPSALQPFSNQREMLVVNTFSVNIDSIKFAEKLAHEFQHLAHWNLDQNEDRWLNEVFSGLAFFFTGAPETRYSMFGGSNSQLFAENPETQLTSRPERKYGELDRTSLTHQAAEKSFGIYLFERFGAEFIKNLANNPDPGVFSVQEELNKLPGSPRFTDVYANWLVAILLDNAQLMDGQYGFADFDPVTVRGEGLNMIRAITGEIIAEQLPPYGSHHYWLRLDQPVKVTFNGSTVARLTPVDPTSGQFAWYSNRGDQSEFTLTNSFDLTGLDLATLDYNVWYELEEYSDYAHVEVSEDGGQTWHILEPAHGTQDNPYDRAYGFGYTGVALDWLSESLDLTPYVGQEIQLRFHVITDPSTNRDGIMLDEISIPELEYFDGAEDDSGGWEAKGFIRSSNLVPAEWIMWLVKASSPMEVERISLEKDQSTEFEIEGLGSSFPSAAIIISPTSPTTTMELDYELVFEHP